MEQFKVIEVPDDAATASEAMGTKPKFWYITKTSETRLFKQGRQNTGEDWAEKFACEIASCLNIPHAHYELAVWKGQRGTVSQKFVPKDSTLIHGNEILSALDKSYPQKDRSGSAFVRVREHTVSRVLAAHRAVVGLGLPDRWDPVVGISSAAEVFVGYLLLDALVGNTDRHHENWAWILSPGSETGTNLRLAPSFDHASCLGRELTDEERRTRLMTRDKGRTVEAYLRRNLSGLYSIPTSTTPLSTIEAFERAAATHPSAARSWIDQLAVFEVDRIKAIAEKFPTTILSETAAEFALRCLEHNRIRLLAIHVGNTEDLK